MRRVILIVTSIILIDQLVKFYIKTHFFLGEDVEVFSWFHLTFVENPGAAYGVAFGGYIGKTILGLVRLFLIYWIVRFIYLNIKKGSSAYFIIPMSMILAGAIGNLIDGIFYSLIFDSGSTYDMTLARWVGYAGISTPDFSGYNHAFLGCVVDMLRFPLFYFYWPETIPWVGGQHFSFFQPVFNIADSAIFVGVVFLFITRKKAFSNISW